MIIAKSNVLSLLQKDVQAGENTDEDNTLILESIPDKHPLKPGTTKLHENTPSPTSNYYSQI